MNDDTNNYTMEELLPVVAKLTAKYTRNESTSVTYEKAEQLMGAVLYCIREYESKYRSKLQSAQGSITENELFAAKKVSATEAYQIGYKKVLRKIEDTRLFYNEMIVCFHSYENENYRDTVERGIPGFFKLYNPRFSPQDSIITMDYPTICGLGSRTGIDAIEQYLKYIALEQEFLGKLSEEYVIHALTAYQADYRKQFDNVCGIVLRDVLIKAVKPKGMSLTDFKKICAENRAELEHRLEERLQKLIQERYEDNQALFHYLKADIRNISAGLAAK